MANEKRLIDRNEIFPNGTFFANAEDPLKSLDELIKRIWSIPTVDAVEVVHGRWVMKETMIRSPFAKNAYCSECHEETSYTHYYCPNCGAKMDGDGNG